MDWTPDEKQLRDELLDRLAYVTGELPGGHVSASATLEVLSVLGKLGWGKLPTAPAAAPADEWKPGRWYRVIQPDSNDLWMETSDRKEAEHEAERKGYPLFRQWRAEKTEWRPEAEQ